MATAEFIDHERETYCWDGKHWYRVSDSTIPPLGLASRLTGLLSAHRRAGQRAAEEAQLKTLNRPWRVVVTGDPAWADAGVIRQELGQLPAGSSVIHGNAGGADHLAAQVADDLGLQVIACPAKPGRQSRNALHLRNKAMLADHKPDLVVAFSANVNGASEASHLVTIARQAGILVRLIAG